MKGISNIYVDQLSKENHYLVIIEQLQKVNENTIQEESATTVEAVKPKDVAKTNTDTQVTNYNGNLLYEESLEFIPRTLRGRQDPRYVFAKFPKQYKNFDFTNEDVLQMCYKY